jgi:hypothetical protein
MLPRVATYVVMSGELDLYNTFQIPIVDPSIPPRLPVLGE